MHRLMNKTVRWTFADGPVAGKTFEHRFNADGSVDYWRVDAGSPKGAPAHEKHCALVEVAQSVEAVSYLAASGFTLTALLNFDTMRIIAIASNDKQWFQQEGTFEVVPPASVPIAF